MSKVDWSEAPEGAEFYASGNFYKSMGGINCWFSYGSWVDSMYHKERLKIMHDYEPRPKEWPSEQRIEQIGQNGAAGEHYGAAESTQSHYNQKELTKYQRNIKGAVIDVYDLLVAYNVTCPATAHAIKKLLMPGERHAKTWEQDINEAIASLERAKELRG